MSGGRLPGQPLQGPAKGIVNLSRKRVRASPVDPDRPYQRVCTAPSTADGGIPPRNTLAIGSLVCRECAYCQRIVAVSGGPQVGIRDVALLNRIAIVDEFVRDVRVALGAQQAAASVSQ